MTETTKQAYKNKKDIYQRILYWVSCISIAYLIIASTVIIVLDCTASIPHRDVYIAQTIGTCIAAVIIAPPSTIATVFVKYS